MADEKNESNIFTLTMPAEIAFCNLFEKRAIKNTTREQWDMTVAADADSPDVKALKSLAVAIFKRKFPAVDITDKRNWQYPWESGEEFIARTKEARGDKAPDNDWLMGKVLIKSHSMLYAPNLSVLMPGRGIVDFRDEARLTVKDKFYPGCQVLAEFNLQPHKVGTNTPGVTAYLNKVLSLNKGERRGGGKSGAETFSAYVGKLSATDPTTEDVSY